MDKTSRSLLDDVNMPLKFTLFDTFNNRAFYIELKDDSSKESPRRRKSHAPSAMLQQRSRRRKACQEGGKAAADLDETFADESFTVRGFQ